MPTMPTMSKNDVDGSINEMIDHDDGQSGKYRAARARTDRIMLDASGKWVGPYVAIKTCVSDLRITRPAALVSCRGRLNHLKKLSIRAVHDQ